MGSLHRRHFVEPGTVSELHLLHLVSFSKLHTHRHNTCGLPSAVTHHRHCRSRRSLATAGANATPNTSPTELAARRRGVEVMVAVRTHARTDAPTKERMHGSMRACVIDQLQRNKRARSSHDLQQPPASQVECKRETHKKMAKMEQRSRPLFLAPPSLGTHAP
jgi:hypothetical protein